MVPYQHNPPQLVNDLFSLDEVIETIVTKRASLPKTKAMLVVILGIDGSGKGYLADKIVAKLAQHNLRVANINIDGWLNLPHKRFSKTNPAEHFYQQAIRFDELFTQLIFPLCDRRSVCVEANFTEETAIDYKKHTYIFEDIDVILLEGIYLLKRL